MKEVIYALGSQLAYYNWHNYKLEEKDMYRILKNQDIVTEILSKGKDDNFIENNTSYELTLSDGKRVTIYKEEDKRLLVMYSEDRDAPDLNPLFKDIFEGWSFIEGMNHEKAFNETNIASVKKIIYRFGPKDRQFTFSYAGLSENPIPINGIKDSGFQAFAMEKGNDILISYRGTDFDTEFLKDMVFTNIPIFFNSIPEQVLCAIYFYEKIKNMNPNKNIHITGHSLGGGLAQFVALYGGNDIKKTVTWNGLGIRNLYETSFIDSNLKLKALISNTVLVGDSQLSFANNLPLNTNVAKELSIKTVGEYFDLIAKDHNLDNLYSRFLSPVATIGAPKANLHINVLKDTKQNPYNEYLKIAIIMRIKENYSKLNDKLINYYLSGDIVKKLSTKTGRSICVDDSSQSSNAGGVGKVVTTGLKGGNMDWHGINNFLPFISDKGEVTANELRENYLMNFMKTLLCGGKEEFQDIKEKAFVPSGRTAREIKVTIIEKQSIYDILEEFALYNKLEDVKNIFEKAKVAIKSDYLLNKNLIETIENKGEKNDYYIRHYLQEKYDSQGYEYVLGSFNNYALIGGVLGQEEAKLYKYQTLHYKKQSQD